MSSLQRDVSRAEPGPLIVLGYRDGVTVIELVGEHDLSMSDELAVLIEQECDRGRGIVVAFTETEFVDSSIIRVLFSGDARMLGRGRRLVLLTASSMRVDPLFHLVGLRDQLLCCDGIDEAIAFASQRDDDTLH